MLKKNVTLTNWKRLSNVPANVNLSRFVQPGVHWREFLVFLDHQLYLYHIKMGVWSALFSNGMCSPAKGCPLAVFDDDQDLVLLSSNGSIYKYFLESGQWKIFDKLSDCRPRFSKSRSFVLDSVFLVSDQPKSLVLLWQEYERPYSFQVSLSTQEDDYFCATKYLYVRRFQNSKTSDPVKLAYKSFLCQTVSHISYAISQSNLYVNIDGSVIYCINNQNVVSTIPLPPLTKTTICSVKDNMFSFGGLDTETQPNSDVSRYNSDTNKWEPIGYMYSCRYSVTAVPFVQEESGVNSVFIVGGKFGESTECKITEICDVGVQ